MWLSLRFPYTEVLQCLDCVGSTHLQNMNNSSNFECLHIFSILTFTLFNRLHVWDLSAGDIFPVLTIEAGGLVDGNLCSFHIASSQIASRQPLNAVSSITNMSLFFL